VDTYYLTVFSKKGEKLMDETFEAENDEQAMELGTKRLEEENYEGHTHRCVNPRGKLVLFHR